MQIIIQGRVAHGNKIGRRMGFPTANIPLRGDVECEDGVYAVKLNYNKREFYGIANLGYKPTIEGVSARSLEVNIFDFEEEIYDKFLSVELLYFIRYEQKFTSLEQLEQQIADDVKQVKNRLRGVLISP